MTRRKPVGVIRQPSSSGSRANARLEFIPCVGGQNPHGSVKWLGVFAPYCGTGVAWTEISWFLIRVGETDVTAKLGITQLALDLISTSWVAGLMNSGYIFVLKFC